MMCRSFSFGERDGDRGLMKRVQNPEVSDTTKAILKHKAGIKIIIETVNGIQVQRNRKEMAGTLE